jgi:hypothetical protein
MIHEAGTTGAFSFFMFAEISYITTLFVCVESDRCFSMLTAEIVEASDATVSVERYNIPYII